MGTPLPWGEVDPLYLPHTKHWTGQLHYFIMRRSQLPYCLVLVMTFQAFNKLFSQSPLFLKDGRPALIIVLELSFVLWHFCNSLSIDLGSPDI